MKPTDPFPQLCRLPRCFAIACALLIATLWNTAPSALGQEIFLTFSAIAAGNTHNLAVNSDGTVLAWGNNDQGQCAPPPGLNGVVTVAAGGIHSLALKADGTVVAWGNNEQGQCSVPAGLNGVVAISAGTIHSLALKADGSVIGWGRLWVGEYITARPPAGLAGVVSMAGRWNHCLAAKSDGTVSGWGGNNFGELSIPPGLNNVVAVSAGGQHSVALRADGTVVSWGYASATGTPDQLRDVIAIASGSNHNLALKRDGTVAAWGHDDVGQCAVPAGLTGVIAIAAGSAHSMALKSDGSIALWGNDAVGGLLVAPPPRIVNHPRSRIAPQGTAVQFSVDVSGLGEATYQWRKDGQNISGATGRVFEIPNTQPEDAGAYSVRVANPYGAMVSAGATLAVVPILITEQPYAHTPAVAGWTVNFRVSVSGAGPFSYQWSKNGSELARENASTLTIPNAQQIHAGTYSVTVQNVYGSVTSAGARLSLVPNPLANRPAGRVVSWSGGNLMPVPEGLDSVVAVAAGGGGIYDHESGPTYHSLALKSDGTVVAWGRENYEETIAPPPGLTGVIAISVGDYHSVALKSDGTVAAWGANYYGQVNNIPNEPSRAIADPLALNGQVLNGVVAIAAGADHTLALKADGSVVAWGGVQVPEGLRDVVAIAAADSNLALKSDGTVVEWFNNGELIPGPTGLSDVVAISMSPSHRLALKSDGTVTAWGINRAGACNVPAGLTGVVAISAGGYFDGWFFSDRAYSLALKADGTVVSWGPPNCRRASARCGRSNPATSTASRSSSILSSSLSFLNRAAASCS